MSELRPTFDITYSTTGIAYVVPGDRLRVLARTEEVDDDDAVTITLEVRKEPRSDAQTDALLAALAERGVYSPLDLERHEAELRR